MWQLCLISQVFKAHYSYRARVHAKMYMSMIIGGNLQGFGFKAYTPGSLQHSHVVWCGGSNEPESLTSISQSTKVLFIAGAQHAGTKWLFDALDAHPTFVSALHAYK
jgi:hypothetical protein